MYRILPTDCNCCTGNDSKTKFDRVFDGYDLTNLLEELLLITKTARMAPLLHEAQKLFPRHYEAGMPTFTP